MYNLITDTTVTEEFKQRFEGWRIRNEINEARFSGGTVIYHHPPPLPKPRKGTKRLS